jgi:hypothetical protein
MRPVARRELHSGGRGYFTPDILPFVQRANELMASKDYGGAAAAYEQAARAVKGSGDPRTPNLKLRAGFACILAGQNVRGVDYVREALSLLANRGEWRRLSKTANYAEDELTLHGLRVEAVEIYTWLKSILPPDFAPSGEKDYRPPLPKECPECGVPILPYEVDWPSGLEPKCGNCGGLLHSGN